MIAESLGQVAGQVIPAGLYLRILLLGEHGAQRNGEALMGVADHELDPGEAELLERANELAPEGLALSIADLEAQPAVEIHSVEVEVGVTAGFQRQAEQGLRLDVDVGADAADLGIDLAGGDAGRSMSPTWVVSMRGQ